MAESVSPLAGVRNRRELAARASDYMASLHEDLRSARRQRTEAGQLKTYCVEADLDETREFSEAVLRLTRATGIEFRATEEEGFLTGWTESARGTDHYALDATDPRFWLIHTTALTERSDRLLQDRIYRVSGLDTAWFPADFLYRIARSKDLFIGVGTKFNDSDFLSKDSAATSLTMRVWGTIAERISEVLFNDEDLKRYFTISSVRYRTELSDEVFANDTLYFSGKSTATGVSFLAHVQSVAEAFRGSYQTAVTGVLEGDAFLRVGPGGRFKGRALKLDLSDAPQEDLGLVLPQLLDGKLPFRFWAASSRIEGDSYTAIVSDLHLGGVFSLVATPELIVIYGRDGLCGNAIARFATLFQQSVNATARLFDNTTDQLVFS